MSFEHRESRRVDRVDVGHKSRLRRNVNRFHGSFKDNFKISFINTHTHTL